MRRLAVTLLGALVAVAGIAGLIVAARHSPHVLGNDDLLRRLGTSRVTFYAPIYRGGGWPSTTYDAVRIVAWALIVFGAVTVAYGLVREFKARPSAS